MALSIAPGAAHVPDDNLTFGGSLAAAPTNAEDNDTFVVTDTGDATGNAVEVYKWDAETSQWKSIDLDTDIEAVAASLAGTVLTVSVTEDGVAQLDTVDLAAIADTDISGVSATVAGQDLTVSVTEDGVTLSDTVTLPGEPDTDVASTRILAGPTSTPTAPTIQVGVTEDGVEVLSNEWPVAPVCPEEMTRAALLALRNAGNLIPGCHYIITNPDAQGNLALEKVLMHAVDANTLSGCYLKTVHDNTAWNGTYDIDTDRVEHVHDHKYNNVVTDRTSIANFPFNVATVTDNRVSFGRLTYTGGTARSNVVGPNSTLTISGGSVVESTLDGDSDLTIIGGTNYEITVSNSSIINQVGTGYIRRVTATNESSVTVGNTNLNENTFRRTSFNSTGSAGSVNYNEFQRSAISATNVASLTLDSNVFAANSQMTVTGAARTYIRYCTMSGYGRFLQSAGTSLTAQYTGIRDYGYVQVLQGTLTANYSSVAGVSYIQNNTPGTNAVDRTTVNNSSRVRFLGTSTACRVYYCEVSSSSYIEHQGTSNGCYFYNCEVTSSSNMFSLNSVNLRAYYNTVSGNSQIYSRNVTGTHYIYYAHAAGHGYIWYDTGTGGRIYAVSVHGQGVLRFRGANAAGRIYYSSFTAYYYLYAENWTVTRTSLHGYGRRTYTVTNPPNGTFTQNF